MSGDHPSYISIEIGQILRRVQETWGRFAVTETPMENPFSDEELLFFFFFWRGKGFMLVPRYIVRNIE